MENEQNKQTKIVPAPDVTAGSDVEMIEVNTPNFFGRHFLHLLAIFGIGFLSFFFIFNVYFVPITIIGSSMQPTINNSITYANDDKHCDIVYYRPKENYDIGDILIVDAVNYLPTAQTGSRPVSSVIKRLIAKPGQTVSFVITNAAIDTHTSKMEFDYTLLVDDQPDPIAEQYSLETNCIMKFLVKNTVSNGIVYGDSSDFVLTKAIYDYAKQQCLGVWANISESNPVTYSLTVERGELFACGDNRNNSTDCRWFGPVKQSDVMGNVRIHVPYGSNMFVAIWNALFHKN